MSLSASSASCNSPTLVDYLAERDLTAYGQTDPSSSTFTDRNQQRVRILKYLAQHPEGVLQTTITHHCIKGWDPTDDHWHPDLSDRPDGSGFHATHDLYYGVTWDPLDGSDADYKFVRDFIINLTEYTDLVETRDLEAGRLVVPTLSLLDLISAGITQTPTEQNDHVYDREFCKKTLVATTSKLLRLSEAQKKLFAKALRSYIFRIKDYRLVFDVVLEGFRGKEQRRTTKPFATRFTSKKRVDRAFARLQDSLEWGYDNADNAVFCTLTTDPKKFDSLYDAIDHISDAFNNLLNYFKGDPDSIADTRQEGIPAWTPELDYDEGNYYFGAEGAVSGKPREKLEYVKVLEFTEAGYPHLHVLFFNVPTRESDGMPWLIDKDELSHYWDKYGQGSIVDTYPLTYCDDLDSLDAEFNDDEGFVSWYRYGDHDHSDEWVEDRVRYHQEDGQIDFDGSDENPMQKTAGSYIGKYVSETYGVLQKFTETDVDDVEDVEGTQFWKLGLYWATGKRFWSPSRGIEKAIDRDPPSQDEDVQHAVQHCVQTSLEFHCEQAHVPHHLLDQTDVDSEMSRSTLHRLVRQTVARFDYLGAYAVWDLPNSTERRVNADVVEELIHNPDEPVALASQGDRPPPVATVWHD